MVIDRSAATPMSVESIQMNPSSGWDAGEGVETFLSTVKSVLTPERLIS